MPGLTLEAVDVGRAETVSLLGDLEAERADDVLCVSASKSSLCDGQQRGRTAALRASASSVETIVLRGFRLENLKPLAARLGGAGDDEGQQRLLR
jgi:hypothetical protein